MLLLLFGVALVWEVIRYAKPIIARTRTEEFAEKLGKVVVGWRGRGGESDENSFGGLASNQQAIITSKQLTSTWTLTCFVLVLVLCTAVRETPPYMVWQRGL
jgi:hypothetical protein